MPRAILFDLGDTLLDFEPMDTRALFKESARSTWEHLVSRGITPPPFEKYARRLSRALRWRYIWAKLTGREFNSLDLLSSLYRRFDIPANDALMREIAWLWYQPIIQSSHIEPDLASTLERLARAGMKLGIVSNTFVPGFVHDRHLEMLDLLRFLSVRVYSSEVGWRKPNRRIFQHACEQLGVAPEQTMFVGDLVKTDMSGAARLGMRTVLKQPYANPSFTHKLADFVIRRVSDLLQILEISRELERFSRAEGLPMQVQVAR